MSEDRAPDLPHIRADRSRIVVLRETGRYQRDAVYRRDMEDFDAILARREAELAEVKSCSEPVHSAAQSTTCGNDCGWRSAPPPVVGQLHARRRRPRC